MSWGGRDSADGGGSSRLGTMRGAQWRYKRRIHANDAWSTSERMRGRLAGGGWSSSSAGDGWDVPLDDGGGGSPGVDRSSTSSIFNSPLVPLTGWTAKDSDKKGQGQRGIKTITNSRLSNYQLPIDYSSFPPASPALLCR